jgi:hypothetical protein
VSRDATLGVTGIASEVCFICHVIPNNLLTDSTQERREDFHMALEAAKRALGTPGFYFTTIHPYFFNPRTNKGTVTVTNGLATVTGVGTSWLSAGIVTVAMARKPTTADVFSADDGKYYTIDSLPIIRWLFQRRMKADKWCCTSLDPSDRQQQLHHRQGQRPMVLRP